MNQSAQDMITSAERIARALTERDTPPGRPVNQTEVYRHRIAALERIVRDLAGKATSSPEIAGMQSAINHLSLLVEEQRALLVEVEEVCGRDGHGGQLEDGESELIDKVRRHLEMLSAPKESKKHSLPAEPEALKDLRDALGALDKVMLPGNMSSSTQREQQNVQRMKASLPFLQLANPSTARLLIEYVDCLKNSRQPQPDPQKYPQPNDYAALELEHLGDPQKGTGVYAKKPIAMWQARPVGSTTHPDHGWREVSPTKDEPTVEQRVAYLRTLKRADGSPAYEFRALVVASGVEAT